jgi:phage repressor protein C with HTH and peptisase S24 domain
MAAQGEVTRRFLYAYQLLRQQNIIKSARQFAISLDYLPQSWNEVVQGRRDMPLDTLYRAASMYRIDPSFLFSGEGDPFFSEHMTEKLRLRTVVVNERGQEQILQVPVSVQGAYPKSLNDATFFETLPSFTLPDFTHTAGTHRCFDVAGDQMEPCLFDGDRVIGSFLHPDRYTNGIRDNHCYVIVTKSEVAIRRVLNQLESTQSIILMADNNYFPPTRVLIEDVREVWLIIQKISPFLHGQTYKEDVLKEHINFISDQITEQNRLIMSMLK